MAVTAWLPGVDNDKVESTIINGSFGKIGMLGTDTLKVGHIT